MYPVLLAEAGSNEHITEDEFSELYVLHKLVERAAPVTSDAARAREADA